MEDFLNQQLEKLHAWNADVVDSGLVLDLLHYHTTALGTAGSRRREEIEAAYGDPQKLTGKLLDQCRSLYLLTGRYPKKSTRLAHDTLAPVVIRAFQDSDRPGQRAARILNVKAREIIYRIPEEIAEGLIGHSEDTKEKLLALAGKDFRGRSKLAKALQEALESKADSIDDLLGKAEWDYGSGDDEVALSLEDCLLVEAGIPGMRRLRREEAELLQRSWQKVSGSDAGVDWMIKKNGYYDRFRNPEGKGIVHQYQQQAGGKVVTDGATGLMWQQSGSGSTMTYDKTKAYIDQLNRETFAGFDDWRLPTLEEAMSLMEAKEKSAGLYIDPVFDTNQRWIWTSTQPRASAAWLVDFNGGYCYGNDLGVFGHPTYVRAVRVGQSSR